MITSVIKQKIITIGVIILTGGALSVGAFIVAHNPKSADRKDIPVDTSPSRHYRN